MRTYDADTLSAFQARGGLAPRLLVWIKARNSATGETEAMGVWNGSYNLSITLEGDPREYLGAGELLQSEPLTAGPGLAVRNHKLNLAAASPEVEDLVKGYDTRFAPVEMHRALINPETGIMIGTPHRVFRGVIDTISFPTEAPGGAPICEIDVVSETRQLTRTLPLKKSQDSQHLRDPSDNFRQYGDISGSVQIYWGELKGSLSPKPPATPKPKKPKKEPRTGDDR